MHLQKDPLHWFPLYCVKQLWALSRGMGRRRPKIPNFTWTLSLPAQQNVWSRCQPAQLEQQHWCEHHAPVFKDFLRIPESYKALSPQRCPADPKCLSHRGLCSAPQGPKQQDLTSPHSTGTPESSINDFPSLLLESSWCWHPPAHCHPCLLLCCRTREKDSPLTCSHAGNTPASLKDDSEW